MPITVNFISISLFILGMIFQRDWIIDLSLYSFLINIIGTLISSGVQIIKGRWMYIFPQLGFMAFLIYYGGMIFMFSPPDFFATHKTIPKNLTFDKPLDREPVDGDFDAHQFVLLNWGQPGGYRYQTTYKPEKEGHFFIKVFEINTNDRLSEERIRKRSKTSFVADTMEEPIQGNFTVYEGNWGEFYGGRVQLWYKPNSAKEYLVEERLYIIEGWQR